MTTKRPRFAFPKSHLPFPPGYRSDPEPARITEADLTVGGFAELLWQHGHQLHHRTTCEGQANLAAWVARRPNLAAVLTNMANPTHRRLAERERLAWVLEKVRDGRGWPAGGKILLAPSGWPIGFRSRPGLGRIAQVEVNWFAETAGLRLLWQDDPKGKTAVLGLPGPSQPAEFVNFDAIVSGNW